MCVHQDFNAVYYMGVHNSRGNPHITLVIRALKQKDIQTAL